MVSKEKIDTHLNLALQEIGEIKPWFDKDFSAWVFHHTLYPVEYSGDSEEEVVENYPLYLKEFIQHRLNDQLSPLMEKKAQGHGGKREGAGRPKAVESEEKVRVYLPKDIAHWIKHPDTISNIRQIMRAYKR